MNTDKFLRAPINYQIKSFVQQMKSILRITNTTLTIWILLSTKLYWALNQMTQLILDSHLIMKHPSPYQVFCRSLYLCSSIKFIPPLMLVMSRGIIYNTAVHLHSTTVLHITLSEWIIWIWKEKYDLTSKFEQKSNQILRSI